MSRKQSLTHLGLSAYGLLGVLDMVGSEHNEKKEKLLTMQDVITRTYDFKYKIQPF